jgi:hypothetical protein
MEHHLCGDFPNVKLLSNSIPEIKEWMSKLTMTINVRTMFTQIAFQLLLAIGKYNSVIKRKYGVYMFRKHMDLWEQIIHDEPENHPYLVVMIKLAKDIGNPRDLYSYITIEQQQVCSLIIIVFTELEHYKLIHSPYAKQEFISLTIRYPILTQYIGKRYEMYDLRKIIDHITCVELSKTEYYKYVDVSTSTIREIPGIVHHKGRDYLYEVMEYIATVRPIPTAMYVYLKWYRGIRCTDICFDRVDIQLKHDINTICEYINRFDE